MDSYTKSMIFLGVFFAVIALIIILALLYTTRDKVSQYISKNAGNDGDFNIVTSVRYNNKIVKYFNSKASYKDPNLETLSKADKTDAELYLKQCKQYKFQDD